ncbi:MAG TPA: VWA domain-containing protein [Casimicrobiaceae bacterium]|nr:VWA domain-containing protein [Casimicrobiaceae bacterium]
MLIGFFLHLRAFRLPVSTREFLTLLEALAKRVVAGSIDEFHALARMTLVKDEQHFDRFDLAFASYFKGIDAVFDVRGEVPAEWLRREFERQLSDEDRRRIAALGGLDKLLETLRRRLAEQRARHAGGSKWIGTGGTSPFGAYGYNPEGVRIGGDVDGGRARSAVRIWDERAFRNLDGDVELNTRNLKIALRRLRRFAREGVPDELDLDGTIDGTARNAGWLDLRMRPERRNRVKLLLFLDSGGSMDPHVTACEELFSAAKREFRHLESFYFHNCIYDHVWRDNVRRRTERVSTLELLRTYGPDWRVVVVGDAAMSPYELTERGGSVEYANDEPGLAWLARVFAHFRRVVWWNPEPERAWEYTRSTQMIQGALGARMFPLTLDGVARGIDALRK